MESEQGPISSNNRPRVDNYEQDTQNETNNSKTDIEYLIIWFDLHIGSPDYYKLLKKEFGMTIDPTQDYINIPKKDEVDIDNLISVRNAESIQDYPLLACDKAEDFLRLLTENADKCIIVIISGTLAMEYIGDEKQLLMFEHEENLLARITRDMGKYFMEKGNIYLKSHNSQEALINFTRSKKLMLRANALDKENNGNELELLNGKPPNYQGLIFQAEQQENQ
ncbi:unnamed protein product [Didymodactylos carnosus]|uniref:Uncharacterized protein n=1 Tax=Didymodactylos carnosus TaxID=1234261 RepID=A0A8S2PW37_9BILA|nr:unnamed protein product [Didymodactylos carnosus]CAF4068882.1 unnamed protein product [Didymodactylos carnosus]